MLQKTVFLLKRMLYDFNKYSYFSDIFPRYSRRAYDLSFLQIFIFSPIKNQTTLRHLQPY